MASVEETGRQLDALRADHTWHHSQISSTQMRHHFDKLYKDIMGYVLQPREDDKGSGSGNLPSSGAV